jgi:hypothetical protein
MVFNEFPDGTIIGSFCCCGKVTGGQFIHAAMIGNAFAADALSGTGFIGAVALL